MFQGKNSQSVVTQITPNTPAESDKTLKIYVCELDDDRTSAFRSTMKSFLLLNEEVELLKSQYVELTRKLFASIQKHEFVCTELHDHLCKKLAVVGYNEFNHKVHVEDSGKVYIIDKSIEIKAEHL